MAAVEFLRSFGIFVLYLITSAMISFCTALLVVLIASKLTKKRKLSDAFYDKVVLGMFWGAFIILGLLLFFGPLRL